MHRRTPLPAALALAASTAWAIKEWHDYYLEARDKLIPAGRYEQAIKSLQEAIRLKPTPALNERPYGMEFEDYLPYFYLGLCYLRTGDFNSAIRNFNIEEGKGAVKKREGMYKELLRLRKEAEDAERQRVARRAREEAQRLLKEAFELAGAKRFEEALTRLAQAQAAARDLDPGIQKQIQDLREKVRADERELADARNRAERIERTLTSGTRLLDEGKDTEAVVEFDAVLALDPRNARALEGKRVAQERILASKTRQALEARFREGKALFEAGQFEKAIPPLTDAAADPGNSEARAYLQKARKVLEGMRAQRELRLMIDRLLAEAEQLLEGRKYPEAQVKFEGVLALDAGNVKAKERLGFAERMTGEALLARWMPNQAPLLNFWEPKGTEIEGPTVAIVGFATDDRAVERIEFRVGGRVVAELSPPARFDSVDSLRSVRFEKEFPLQHGPNEITVRAVDSMGAERVETFRLTRRLRFYETRAFLPSAAGTALGLIGLAFALQRARRRRALRRRFNPYIAGAPIFDDEMFFGRQKLMSRLLNVLHHNSLMITGERRIGKTTFLYRLRKVLEADDGTDYKFFPIFTDLQGVPESGFFHAVMSDVVEGLPPSPATRAALRFRPEEQGYDGRDFSHDLQRIIDELRTRTDKRVKLALLIDEVDVLNEYSERINQRLRSIFMKTFSEHLVAVMSGVGIKRTWKSEVSPWYNFFDEVELGGFTQEEAESLIREPVAGVFRYEPEAIERIVEWSELKPYLIQKFCIHAINRILDEGRTTVTASHVEAVREAVLLEGRHETRASVRAEEQASA